MSAAGGLVELGGNSLVIASVLGWHYNCRTGSWKKPWLLRQVFLSRRQLEPCASAAWVAGGKMNSVGIHHPLLIPSFGSVALLGGWHGGGWYQPLARHVLLTLAQQPQSHFLK